jgi:protein-tyrosine phosphatase
MPTQLLPYVVESGLQTSGRLAIASRPRGFDWLEDDPALWRGAGTTSVVSLLEDEEATELGLADEAAVCQKLGLRYSSFPIPDREVPDQQDEFFDLIEELVQQLLLGERLVIHCRQGIGRSGLVAAAVLNSFEMPLQECLERISLARGVPVPETKQQRDWLMTHLMTNQLAR